MLVDFLSGSHSNLQHPWNKWQLADRRDKEPYSTNNHDNAIVKTWENKTNNILLGNTYHRIDAPAVIEVNLSENIVKEHWYISGVVHRLDGPAYRTEKDNMWFLFSFDMLEEKHREIVDIYNELGDWLLAFSLSSSSEYYDKEYLKRMINQVMKGYSIQ